jgi:hypothetical protein
MMREKLLESIMGIKDILGRLEVQEKNFCGSLVLAPVIAGRVVSTKIAGVVCHLRLESQGEVARGWSVLEVLSSDRARWLRAATRAEREKYLSLLPRVRFIALENSKNVWAAFPAQQGDARFRLNGPAVVREVEAGVQPFDTVLTRFDGNHFWFEAPDTRRSPALAAYLRESMVNSTLPENLHKKGLSSEERAAYMLALYGPPAEEELVLPVPVVAGQPDMEEEVPYNWRHNAVSARLARSVAHGGAQLVSYIEREGVYSVTYRFGERTHTSTVRSSDLKVQTSGICLSGRDGDFDLTSLVGVMQEASKVEPWQFDHDYY